MYCVKCIDVKFTWPHLYKKVGGHFIIAFDGKVWISGVKSELFAALSKLVNLIVVKFRD